MSTSRRSSGSRRELYEWRDGDYYVDDKGRRTLSRVKVLQPELRRRHYSSFIPRLLLVLWAVFMMITWVSVLVNRGTR